MVLGAQEIQAPTTIQLPLLRLLRLLLLLRLQEKRMTWQRVQPLGGLSFWSGGHHGLCTAHTARRGGGKEGWTGSGLSRGQGGIKKGGTPWHVARLTPLLRINPPRTCAGRILHIQDPVVDMPLYCKQAALQSDPKQRVWKHVRRCKRHTQPESHYHCQPQQKIGIKGDQKLLVFGLLLITGWLLPTSDRDLDTPPPTQI